MRFSFALVLGATAIARAAAAAPDDASATAGSAPARPQFSFGMVGGLLQPTGAMKDSHQRGLIAGLRLAWTSRIGLGIEAAIDYSPLPQRPTDTGDRFDTTYATAAIGPRFAAGWTHLQFAVAAGGGVAVDHTATASALLATTTSSTEVAPAAEVGLEIDVPVVDGGGFMLTGGGTRAFGDLAYQYAWAMGGLALSF
jgi:hypothetical protein